MPSEEIQVHKKESTRIVSQAAPVAPSLSTNANERAGLSQSQSRSFIDSRNLVISGGQFNHTLGHHTNLVININPGSPSSSPPLNETHNINLPQLSDQSSQVDHEENHSQVSSQSQEISFQKSNDIYERHLRLKGRGFPLWIPDPNQVLHLDYRRTGVRIGDVGIITHSGAFSFLFNICLPHNDPVNPRMLPEHFAPISPPIKAANIEKFRVFKNSSHLASASVRKRSQTGTAISDIVFESSASEGAILTMPRGARSEDLGNLARFREYAAANVADWYRFVNGPLGREAQNGDVRLVVGFDKTTSWGIATFANQTQENSCLLKFGPSEGDSASNYTWSEYSGVADVRAGPDSDEIDELRIDGDPPDVQFENQCLFVRTLNVTLADNIWGDIHSSSDSIPVNSQYPRAKDYSDSNRPQSNNSDSSSDFSPPQGAQSGTQRRLQDVNFKSDENPSIFVSGPVESISITAHPSKALNDALLAINPTAKMVITHDDDWSSVSQDDPNDLVENILASRDIYQENGVVFLEPKKMINEISEGSTSVNSYLSNFFSYLSTPQDSVLDTPQDSVLDTPLDSVLDTPLFYDLDSVLDTPHDSILDTPLFYEANTSSVVAKPPATRRKVTATGIRKGVTPEILLDESGPTQSRNYVTPTRPSVTSRKDFSAVYAHKRARSKEFGDEEEDQLDDYVLPPNPTEKDLIEQKRLQNTLAARRSRKRKLEHMQLLETSLEKEMQEKKQWRERASMILDQPVPDFTANDS